MKEMFLSALMSFFISTFCHAATVSNVSSAGNIALALATNVVAGSKFVSILRQAATVLTTNANRTDTFVFDPTNSAGFQSYPAGFSQ